MAPSEPARLEELDPTPPGAPSEMRKAHANGMRKTVAQLKNKLANPEDAEALIKMGLLTYLGEWDTMYAEGAGILGLTTTERTILIIRQDTVGQVIKELRTP